MGKSLILLKDLEKEKIDAILERGEFWSQEQNFRVSKKIKELITL